MKWLFPFCPIKHRRNSKYWTCTLFAKVEKDYMRNFNSHVRITMAYMHLTSNNKRRDLKGKEERLCIGRLPTLFIVGLERCVDNV